MRVKVLVAHHDQLFAIPWTVLSIDISSQEYWNGLSFPSPGDLPDSEIPLCMQILYNLSSQRCHWAQIIQNKQIIILHVMIYSACYNTACNNLLCKYMYQKIPSKSHEMFGDQYTYLFKYVHIYIYKYMERNTYVNKLTYIY